MKARIPLRNKFTKRTIDTEKVKTAIERLRAFEPEDGYYLAYSGGKDSDCIKILACLACVKFEAVHNLTTVDAPETVYYIKSQSDVRIESPELSMWQLIVKKGDPTHKADKILLLGIERTWRKRQGCCHRCALGRKRQTSRIGWTCKNNRTNTTTQKGI